MQILNTLQTRIGALQADPVNVQVSTFCVAGSECERKLTETRDRMIAGQLRVEGGQPLQIDQIRAVSSTGNGGFLVKAQTHFTEGRLLVSPDESQLLSTKNQPPGYTFWFEPFPEDVDFPWRLLSDLADTS